MHNSPELKEVEKPAPYPYFDLPKNEDHSFLNKANEAYTRWIATRSTNPYVVQTDATGFDGYFYGSSLTPQEVAQEIATLGENTLLAIRRLYPYDYGHIRKVWRVAQGEIYDLRTLSDLNAYLLMNIGRLRLKVHPDINPEGDLYRRSIANLVLNARMDYLGTKTVSKHKIAIPKDPQPSTAIQVNDSLFHTQALKDGYRFMQLLGKAGYPLVQLAIRRNRV